MKSGSPGLISVGFVCTAHGIHGEVKVKPLTDDPGRFSKLEWVYIDGGVSAAGRTPALAAVRKITIEHYEVLPNDMIVKFKGIDDREAAMSIRGAYLKIERKDAVDLPDGSFFICDLIGLRVMTDNGKHIGSIKDIIQTGSNDVYVVRNDTGNEVLIPALKSVVSKVSLDEGFIEIRLPEGLMNDDRYL